MSEVLILPVIFKGHRYRSDKSCSINFITELEIKPEMLAVFGRYQDMHGFIAWKEDNKLTEEEIKLISEVDIKREGKSLSQRLRNVLYRVHEQLGDSDSFDNFYAEEMEKIIQHYKNKLE